MEAMATDPIQRASELREAALRQQRRFLSLVDLTNEIREEAKRARLRSWLTRVHSREKMGRTTD
jgi:hypothetical protein